MQKKLLRICINNVVTRICIVICNKFKRCHLSLKFDSLKCFDTMLLQIIFYRTRTLLELRVLFCALLQVQKIYREG